MPEARFVFGWLIPFNSFCGWCESRNIDIDDYLSDPELYQEIPSYINIQLICPYPNALLHDYQCSFHIVYCTGSLESIQDLPTHLVQDAIEFMKKMDPTAGDPSCKAILHYV